MSLKFINTDNVQDESTVEALEIIKDTLIPEPFISSGFEFITATFTASGTFKVAHGLGFKPLDVIQSSLTGAGALTWNYGSFDSTNLSVTVTDACVVRAFIGAYR